MDIFEREHHKCNNYLFPNLFFIACRCPIDPTASFPLWDDGVWGAGSVALNRFVSDFSGACVALVYTWPFDSLIPAQAA